MDRPNILFFFTDQQRFDTCGCYGQRLPVTPNLDRLAERGTRFANAFTCQPVCGPARACLQTGRYATDLGCFKNNIPLPQDIPTLATRLTQAGYQTAYVGKWHLASGEGFDCATGPIPHHLRGGYQDYWVASDVLEFTSHGYDGFFTDDAMRRVDFTGYRPDCQTDYVLDFLDHRRDGRPFLMFTSYIEPHHQNDHCRYEGPVGARKRFADFDPPGDLVGTGGDWRDVYPDYLGQCHALDRNLGRVMDKLDQLGLTENTLIVYTSDHGSHFRTRNSEYKRACHDGCTHIPLVIAGPGFDAGRVADQLVSLMDLPITLTAAAGADCAGMAGNPLQLIAQGLGAQLPSHVFIQISESQVGRAVRTARYKYSVRAHGLDGNAAPGSPVYREDCLYDLADDPFERTNLVSHPGYAEVRAQLARLLIRDMVQAGEQAPEILPL